MDIETSVQASGHMWSSLDETSSRGSGGGNGSGGGGGKSGVGGGVGENNSSKSGQKSGDKSSKKSGDKNGNKSGGSGGGSGNGSKGNTADGSGSHTVTGVEGNDVDNSNVNHEKNVTSGEKKKNGGEMKGEEAEVKGEGEGWYIVTDLGRPLVNADAVYYEMQPNTDDDRPCGESNLVPFAYSRCRVYCAHPDGLVSVRHTLSHTLSIHHTMLSSLDIPFTHLLIPTTNHYPLGSPDTPCCTPCSCS